jgi:hypothetical protein
MDLEPSSTRRELPPLVPLHQIAYFDEDGRSALTLQGLAILRSPDVIIGHDLLTGSETVFYGRDDLERSLQTGHSEGRLCGSRSTSTATSSSCSAALSWRFADGVTVRRVHQRQAPRRRPHLGETNHEMGQLGVLSK